MAGNYTAGNDVGSYSHPHFTVMQTAHAYSGAAATASAVQFAMFNSRNKILVTRCNVMYVSQPSLVSAGTLCCIFYDSALTATTLKAMTFNSCSAGFATSLTLTPQTLSTLNQHIALVTTANEKGDVIVSYDYQVLYPDTYV